MILVLFIDLDVGWIIVYMVKKKKNHLLGEPQWCLESNPHHMYSGAAGASGESDGYGSCESGYRWETAKKCWDGVSNC